MSKIKDKILDDLYEQNKELEASQPKGYRFEEDGHYHSLCGRPLLGTSTVVGVLSKNLTWWSAELSAVTCLEAGEHIPTIREEYLKAKEIGKPGIDALQKKYPIFKKARFAHFEDKNTKADKGTDMHGLLEEYCKRCLQEGGKPQMVLEEGDKKLFEFANWAIENVDVFMFSEKHVFSEKLWTGGIMDIIFRLKDGKTCLGDFKSSPISYISQFIQISGYHTQLSENGIYEADKKLSDPIKIDCYCVFPFGSKKLIPEFRYDLEQLKVGFKNCVELYKLTN